jgi:hypothetical protein
MRSNILFLIVVSFFLSANAHAQFKQLVVEEVENEAKVPGKTYRVYAEMTTVGDQIFVVYGDSAHPMEVNCTKPFFQSKEGGPLSKNSSRNLIESTPTLKYDSWVTIGSIDNYDNNVNILNVSFDEFEKSSKEGFKTKDGAWFCIPTDKQASCKEDKRILLMQFTTEGEVKGKINIMGKSKAGETYNAHDVAFTCGGKKKGK